jgi:hypothetical protein
MAVSIMLVLSWVLAPCGFVDQCQWFREASCLHLPFPSLVTSALKMEPACFSKTFPSNYKTTWRQKPNKPNNSENVCIAKQFWHTHLNWILTFVKGHGIPHVGIPWLGNSSPSHVVIIHINYVSELQPQPPTGVLSFPQMIHEYCEPWWNDIVRKNQRTHEKSVPVPLCPPQILHGLTRA